jgi:hypothetical protein
VGPQRDDENSHGRRRSTPKVTLAGLVDGFVDGRPVSFIANSQNLVLAVQRWRTLLAIRRSSCSVIEPLRTMLTRADIRLFVRLPWLGEVEVHPNPSLLVRSLLPAG